MIGARGVGIVLAIVLGQRALLWGFNRVCVAEEASSCQFGEPPTLPSPFLGRFVLTWVRWITGLYVMR